MKLVIEMIAVSAEQPSAGNQASQHGGAQLEKWDPDRDHSEQRGGREDIASFFQRFADYRIEQAFPRVEVSGRLVVNDLAVDFFLDQQILAVAFADCGDGDMRFPDRVSHVEFAATTRRDPAR